MAIRIDGKVPRTKKLGNRIYKLFGTYPFNELEMAYCDAATLRGGGGLARVVTLSHGYAIYTWGIKVD